MLGGANQTQQPTFDCAKASMSKKNDSLCKNTCCFEAIKTMSAIDIPPDPRRHKDACEELCHRDVLHFASQNGRFRVWNSLTGEDTKGKSSFDTALAFSSDGYGYLCHQEKTTWIFQILQWSVWKHVPSERLFGVRVIDGLLEQVWLQDRWEGEI